jgi:hypothetical protein
MNNPVPDRSRPSVSTACASERRFGTSVTQLDHLGEAAAADRQAAAEAPVLPECCPVLLVDALTRCAELLEAQGRQREAVPAMQELDKLLYLLAADNPKRWEAALFKHLKNHARLLTIIGCDATHGKPTKHPVDSHDTHPTDHYGR